MLYYEARAPCIRFPDSQIEENVRDGTNEGQMMKFGHEDCR